MEECLYCGGRAWSSPPGRHRPPRRSTGNRGSPFGHPRFPSLPPDGQSRVAADAVVFCEALGSPAAHSVTQSVQRVDSRGRAVREVGPPAAGETLSRSRSHRNSLGMRFFKKASGSLTLALISYPPDLIQAARSRSGSIVRKTCSRCSKDFFAGRSSQRHLVPTCDLRVMRSFDGSLLTPIPHCRAEFGHARSPEITQRG